nr:MAG TPA: hypothetical protein [Caudoviricetes sp.]DAY52301.1 MAG TPA: hypothetical protein [Caudoviricetes sp.]
MSHFPLSFVRSAFYLRMSIFCTVFSPPAPPLLFWQNKKCDRVFTLYRIFLIFLNIKKKMRNRV